MPTYHYEISRTSKGVQAPLRGIYLYTYTVLTSALVLMYEQCQIIPLQVLAQKPPCKGACSLLGLTLLYR